MAHNKVYGICESKCQVEVYSKEQVDSMACPKNHATTSTQYGIGSTSNFGHVKIKNDLNVPNGSMDDVALSGEMGYALSRRFDDFYTKSQIDKMTYHTDWAKLPLKSGVGAATLGRGTPQYKKIGNQVFIRGTANVKPSENGIVIATVPSGFEPNAQEYFRQYAEGTRVAQLLVKPSGEIKLDWVANISDGKKYTESLDIQLNMSYFID